ncbi:eukaryotic translation initiation factor 6 [Ophiostoma piceae UAMH 11346]|uniref:Eukaryotic translation initiation factor 6 n=1 Tax=Ophiostoma piceae (strain UAMH 11346) TaxID=1262450 RepID=S3CE39_OPHP1|nr:eukaryotic translation initiation factor 6 [Ophiostoma piceae UAMH 11346]
MCQLPVLSDALKWPNSGIYRCFPLFSFLLQLATVLAGACWCLLLALLPHRSFPLEHLKHASSFLFYLFIHVLSLSDIALVSPIRPSRAHNRFFLLSLFSPLSLLSSLSSLLSLFSLLSSLLPPLTTRQPPSGHRPFSPPAYALSAPPRPHHVSLAVHCSLASHVARSFSARSSYWLCPLRKQLVLLSSMSANNFRRDSARQRSPSDFVNFLNGHYQHTTHPGSSSHPSPPHDRLGRRSQQAPIFTPPEQNHYPSDPIEGPALAPLSFERTTATPQQPLPPLRSLSRGIPIPTLGSLPHLYSQGYPSRASPPPLSAFPRLGQSQTPAVGNLPFGYRYSRRHPSTLNAGVPPLDETPRGPEAEFRLRNSQDVASQDDTSNRSSQSQTSEISSSYPYVMSSRTGGNSGSRRDSQRSEETGRVNKRRRVDSDKISPPLYKAFRYGRHGQVEPGALKMEISSCDGGLYNDGAAHAAENILKADNSVYCTKGNRCNIVLQHQGNTPFSLKELIIRAPAKNYSYPVRQGVVFLSMSKDELLQKDQYHSRAYPINTTLLFDRINSFRQRATEILNNSVNGHGRQDENFAVEDPNDIPHEMYRLALNRTNARHAPSSSNTVHNDLTAELDNAEDPPRFYLVTECSDDEEGDTDTRSAHDRGSGWRSSATRWSPAPLRARTQRRQSIYDDDLLDNSTGWGLDNNYAEDDDDDTELYDLGDALISSPDSPPGDEDARNRGLNRGERDRSRAFYIPGESLQGSEGGASAAYEQPHASSSTFECRNGEQDGSGLTEAQPNAKFYIEEHKNKCTIRFNPPVTTRYILLKMWNPHHDIGGNIDIQGVVAKGFAGPRFFPVNELR